MKFDLYIFDLSGTLVKRMRPPETLIPIRWLKQLRKRGQLAVLTGARKSETLNILRKITALEVFSIICTKDDTPLRKPDPRLIKQLIRKSKSAYPVYIGDNKNDARMAREAKVKFIWIKDFLSLYT